jgi:hypothetical protein
MDKLKHFLLCSIVTFALGWTYGLTVGLTIEFVQAEAWNAGIKTFLRRLFSRDSLLDLVADGFGIGAGLLVRGLL